jgi:hypothetical protein
LLRDGHGTNPGTTLPAGLQQTPAPEFGVELGVAVGVAEGLGVAVGEGLGVVVGVGFGVAVGFGVTVGVGSPDLLQHLNFGFNGTPAG